MYRFFGNDAISSALRSLLRAAVVCGTAFGLKLTADQVAAIQLVIESILQLGKTLHSRS